MSILVGYLFSILILIISYNTFHKYYYNNFAVVTGASSNHELSLIQFIYHCFANNEKNNIILIVWDLGFSYNFSKLFHSIIKHNHNIIYKKFNYSQYPPYFNINKNKGEYAWKAIIINITFYMMKTTLLWLDSGCVIEKSLYKVFYDINKYQCWSVYSCGNISTWTHIGMIKYYNISSDITKRRTCNGALVGFKWNSKKSKETLNEWVKCSINRECIAPNGSNRKNHRQDQSALSILLYKNGIFKNCPFNTYNIRTHRDIKNYTIVNKILYKLIEK